MNLKAHTVTAISYIRKPVKRKLLSLCYQLKSKTGIEIGGPSSFFRAKGYFPIYLFAKRIDGVNYSAQTVWEGKINEGPHYKYYNGKIGYQYIAEATDLSKIKSESYDFVLSCHSLEHVANVINAIHEWHRILKKDGKLVLVLPDKRFTFDHDRPYTTFGHLLKDYENNIDEHDTTHFNEIMQFHDVSMDEGVNSKDELQQRLQESFVNRCVHHHVFNQQLVKELLTYCGFEIIHQQEVLSFHLVTVAKKM
jgi:predicted SAM-dependent methyltransferase